MTTLLVVVALTEAAVLATPIYLHRALAHRSVTDHPVASVLFRTVRVAVHRKHHAFTDCEGDPHSPRLLGFWRVQLFNAD